MMRRRMGPGVGRPLMRTAAVVGTASVVSGTVQHHQQQKYAAQDQAKYDQQAAAQQAAYDQQAAAAQTAAPAPAAEPDYMAELEKLAQLKNQGVITEEEFQAKKAQILGI